MDRAFVILISAGFTLVYYLIRAWLKQRKERRESERLEEERKHERLQKLISGAMAANPNLDLLEALDALYQENLKELVQLPNPSIVKIENGKIYTKQLLVYDNMIIMAEMIRLRKERTDKQRAQIERESGFEVIHSARV